MFKSPQRCFIAGDGFEFLTEHVSYILVKMTTPLPVQLFIFTHSPTAYVESNKLHIEGFTLWSRSLKMWNVKTVWSSLPVAQLLFITFVFYIPPHWKFALGEHPFIVTQEIFKNGPVMQNCLLGLESKQLYFGWSEALEPIWIKRWGIRKAYFQRQGSKYAASTLSSGRLLKLCLQCRERSQHRWLGTKGSGLFLMPLNGSTLFLS